MNEKTRLFLYVLAKHVSYIELDRYFEEMELDYGNKFPPGPYPAFKQLADALVERLEE